MKYKIIRWIGGKTPKFCVTEEKRALKSDMEYEVLVIDSTETPIERPKKSKNTFIQERRKNIH